MDPNTIDQQGLAELALLALQQLDTAFSIWMSGTFAVIVAAHYVGTRLKRRAVYAVAVLYLSFTALYASRLRWLGALAEQYLADMTLYEPPGTGLFAIFRPLVFLVGTVSALYILLRPGREIDD